jgi:hypothetical protein
MQGTGTQVFDPLKGISRPNRIISPKGSCLIKQSAPKHRESGLLFLVFRILETFQPEYLTVFGKIL